MNWKVYLDRGLTVAAAEFATVSLMLILLVVFLVIYRKNNRVIFLINSAQKADMVTIALVLSVLLISTWIFNVILFSLALR